MEILSREQIDSTVNGHSLVDVINYTELEVLTVLRELYESDDELCRCAICTEDIYALTLNKLPAKYIQSTSRRKLDSSSEAAPVAPAIKNVMLEAVRKVKARPNH
jgi:hypothetical protein